MNCHVTSDRSLLSLGAAHAVVLGGSNLINDLCRGHCFPSTHECVARLQWFQSLRTTPSDSTGPVAATPNVASVVPAANTPCPAAATVSDTAPPTAATAATAILNHSNNNVGLVYFGVR